MHDPDVVAFEIPRPWPKGSKLNGRRYWPAMVTIWHREPRGHDSGEICKHYRRWQEPDGAWKSEILHGWRWHVHHWHIQVIPLQAFRRTLLTRCAWCHGRSTKTNPANISHQWHAARGRWWRGEPGLYHHDCNSVASARYTCSCEHPVTTSPYERCARCNLPGGGRSDLQREAGRILIEEVPEHTAPSRETMNLVRNLWAIHRANTADALAIEEDLDVDTTTEA